MTPIGVLRMRNARVLVRKVMIITSGTNFTVPSDWNSNKNSIHCIGGGATAVSSTQGGASGGYVRKDNVVLTPGASVGCRLGSGATQDNTRTYVGSSFNPYVQAGGANGATGGGPGYSIGDVIVNGASNSGGAGGCGAPGPNGPGVDNVSSLSGTAGDGGLVKGGTGRTIGNGVAGANGATWTDTSSGISAGPGGGGGGSSGSNSTGGAGGRYGAGGGAGTLLGGAAGKGLIVLEWWA